VDLNIVTPTPASTWNDSTTRVRKKTRVLSVDVVPSFSFPSLSVSWSIKDCNSSNTMERRYLRVHLMRMKRLCCGKHHLSSVFTSGTLFTPLTSIQQRLMFTLSIDITTMKRLTREYVTRHVMNCGNAQSMTTTQRTLSELSGRTCNLLPTMRWRIHLTVLMIPTKLFLCTMQDGSMIWTRAKTSPRSISWLKDATPPELQIVQVRLK